MKSVLIIDDEELVRNILSMLAERCGAKVTTAESGEEAISILASGRSFDAVILDLVLPDVCGWDVLDFIEGGTRVQESKVVVLSGLSISDREKAKLQHRAAALLDKCTFDQASFETLLRRILG